MNEVMSQNEVAAKCQQVLQVANRLYQEKPDWVTFFRETLGVKGAARSVFPTQEEYDIFEQSKEFSEIQNMVAGLRKGKSGKNESIKVITVRLPESLHEALKDEASNHNTSMNKLCISKLLQVLVDGQEAARAESQADAAAVSPNPAPQSQLPSVYSPQFDQASQSGQSARPAPPAPSTPQPTPSFRSTYRPSSNGSASNGQPRFGQ